MGFLFESGAVYEMPDTETAEGDRVTLDFRPIELGIYPPDAPADEPQVAWGDFLVDGEPISRGYAYVHQLTNKKENVHAEK